MTSKQRLSVSVESEVSHVWYSTSGSSAMWPRRTAVPNMPRSGGTTLSFTRRRLQKRMTSASSASLTSWLQTITRSGIVPPHASATRCSSATSPGESTRSPVSICARDVVVDVAEQLELAARGLLERAAADEQRGGRRRPRPPQGAGGGAQQRGEDGRGQPEADGAARPRARPRA